MSDTLNKPATERAEYGTPRTDAERFFRDYRNDKYAHPHGPDVSADFAEELERDLAAARAERDQWRECAMMLECANTKAERAFAVARFDALKAQEAGR